MTRGALTLAILTGQDSPATRLALSALARLPHVRILGILVDAEPAPLRARLRNLRRNLRRQGWSYPWFRLGTLISDVLDRLASRVVSEAEVSAALRRAFPERAFSLADFGERYRIPLFDVGNLNGTEAVETLRRLAPDLGIVLGTRILKRATFSIPRLGCINLHLGKVPEYRGMPPGFWELYEGERSAGVTVHMVDDSLDSGAVLGEDTVPIHAHDTPDTLRRRLEIRGQELLVRCVAELAEGRARPRPQPPSSHRPRTSPTRRQRRELEERLRLPSRPAWVQAAKTVAYLLVYRAGLFHLVSAWRRIAGASRACILLYHRVNDLTDDTLTTGVRRFVEHMLVLGKYYSVIPTSALVGKLKAGERLPSGSVAIHFDDGYRDVCTEASRVLAELGFPAACFVASGYVDTDRTFPHDANGCPWVLENLRRAELVELTRRGFEIGSHTINHVDLGQCPDDVAEREVVQSRRNLEAITGRPVTLLSYPFGQSTNIRSPVVELIRRSGYETLFSADGGYVTGRLDPFHLPRVGVSGHTRPLDLLMEIEGLSLGALRRRWNARRSLGK